MLLLPGPGSCLHSLLVFAPSHMCIARLKVSLWSPRASLTAVKEGGVLCLRDRKRGGGDRRREDRDREIRGRGREINVMQMVEAATECCLCPMQMFAAGL